MFFLDVKNNPGNRQEYYFLDYSACQIFSLNLLVCEYFLVLFDNFPNNSSLDFCDYFFYLGIKSLTSLASYPLRLMALAFFLVTLTKYTF